MIDSSSRNKDVVIWKDIPGFSNYNISEYGEVIRIKDSKTRKAGSRPRPTISTNSLTGYYRYKLINDIGDKINIGGHILVALAFHGPKPSSKHYATHWDDDGLNNYYKNIKWDTHRGNSNDVKRNGQLKGSKNPKAKLTNELVIHYRKRYIKGGISITALAKEIGLAISTTRDMLNGTHWTTLPFASVRHK
jgi:hypothetical protein